MPRQFPRMMLPYNGHYWTFDKWLVQIETLVDAGRVYDDSGVSQRVSSRDKQLVRKALSDALKDKEEGST